VPEQSSNQWEPDDAMAVQSGAVSEDAQPVATQWSLPQVNSAEVVRA
jgi:hypothetical protein